MTSEEWKDSSFQVTGAAAEKVRLLATAWKTTENEVILRLLEDFLSHGRGPARAVSPDRLAVHAIYNGNRVEGEFEPHTGRVIIGNGPLAGRAYRSPSGAAIAVVQSLNPTVSPSRNGWNFWVITDTGEFLGSLRRQ